MGKMCKCKACGAEIATSAKTCPQCGAPNKKMGCLPTFLCVIVIFVAIIAVAAILGGGETPNTPDNSGNTVSTNGENKAEDTVIIDNDQMKVTYQKVVDGEDLGVSGAFYLWLKIENKTEGEIVASLTDADVNGESVSMVMTGVPLNIRPGNSGATGFIFTTSQLSIDSVDDAEKVTFRVSFRDAESYAEIAVSDLITVDLHK